MNIIFVSHCSFQGQSAYHVHSIAKELAALGCSCLICVPDSAELAEQQVTPAVPILNYQDALEQDIVFPDGCGPSLIHCWTPREFVRQFTTALAERYGCPYVVHLEDNEREILTRELKSWGYEEIEKLSSDMQDSIIPPNLIHPRRYWQFMEHAAGSTALIDRLLEHIPVHVPRLVFWPGYDELFSTMSADLQSELRNKYTVDEDAFVILYSGNFHEINRDEIKQMLLALALVKRQGVPLKLLKTGHNKLQTILDPKILDTFMTDLGFLPRAQLRDLLSIADVIIQPGTSDAFNDFRFPSKLPEALISGTPVILPHSNLGRFLVDGINALVTWTGGIDELVSKIRTLYENPELRQTIGANGQAFAREHLQWGIATQNILAFYKEQCLPNEYTVSASKDLIFACDILGQLAKDEISVNLLKINRIFAKLEPRMFTLDPAIGGLEDRMLQDGETFIDRTKEIEEIKNVLAEVSIQSNAIARTASDALQQVFRLQDAVAHMDKQFTYLNKIRVDHNTKINSLSEVLADQSYQIADMERQISLLAQGVAERDSQMTAMEQGIIDRDAQITVLNQTMAERDYQVASLQNTASELKAETVTLQKHLDTASFQLQKILASKSWRITRIFRFTRRNLINKPYCFIRRKLSDYAHLIWQQLPLSNRSKMKLKNTLFESLPLFFRWTEVHRRWKRFNTKSYNYSTEQPPLPPMSAPINRMEPEYVPLLVDTPPKQRPVKLICFYLPQFHAIPENNAWWCEGFTEWTNVKPAVRLFEGHYQPHVPGELGYYDLLNPDIQRRQIELAKLYGIEGFCSYFYWFGGRRLLETPLLNYLNDSTLDLPFCLCWANENWSRRWDGLNNEILIAQHHSADDDLAFISYIARYMQDSRYIRISGKPLLIVYRPSLLPSSKQTAKRWREWCSSNGIGEIYLAYTQSFDNENPNYYGFDAAIEFPPNNSALIDITGNVRPLDAGFNGMVYDWTVFVNRSTKYSDPGYNLFRGVCPSWDNTPRRKNFSTIFFNNTPERYSDWLKNAIADTRRRFSNPDERIVFINAWNEWGEGAHLEPDRRYGYAWLQATRDALLMTDYSQHRRKLVIVSHDAHPHGAQYLALTLAKTLATEFNFQIALILLGEGMLSSVFNRWATVHNLANDDHQGAAAITLADNLFAAGYKVAIVNTTVSGLFLETLSNAGFRCIALIHELRGIIEAYGLHAHALAIARHAETIVFPADQVADAFRELTPVRAEQIKIRPQGLYRTNAMRGFTDSARSLLRKHFGLSYDTRIILGMGYADFRKGVDLFVRIGLEMAMTDPRVYSVWVGHWEPSIQSQVEQLLSESNLADHILFTGFNDDTDAFFAGADVFALTSREDPFPSVVIQSLEVSVPVVAFEGVGGITSLLQNGCGVLVPTEDITCFAHAVTDLLHDSEKAIALGERGAELVQEHFKFEDYAADLLNWANLIPKRLSVIVPNYNYARYLEQRLNSIISQTYLIHEIIVLDDASTDESMQVIEDCLTKTNIDYRVYRNQSNSGSVFDQWRKGIEKARGDYIWICEADDFADSDFSERVIEMFDDPLVAIGYSQSRQVDENGQLLANDYLEYTNDISTTKWLENYIVDGMQELASAMVVKNTIPNVSAVILRKHNLLKALDQCREDLKKLKYAGDWLIYSEILKVGKIGYVAESLNSHRRHNKSVTLGAFDAGQLAEITLMQNRIASYIAPGEDIMNTVYRYRESLCRQFNSDSKQLFIPAID